MFIRSERLFLRPCWPEDWNELLPLISDEEIVRHLATAPWPYTEEHAKEFSSRPQDRRFPHFVVTMPTAEGTRLIGSVGLGQHDGAAELGYWIARFHWGQGYATEAARSVLRLAVALGHRQLTAFHFTDNPASGRVLTKLGFRATGDTFLRHSAGRGEEAPAFRYELDLATGNVGPEGSVMLAA